MRIVALLTSYNESRYIGHILEHYLKHGIEVYLLDNESDDDTVEIARQYLNDNLVDIKIIPRSGKKEWFAMLRRKEDLAESLMADWFVHADPDEFRLPPDANKTLAKAIEEVDLQGYNAINFMEYTFVPTLEEPDHDHPNFLNTMQYYYPFLPSPLNRLNGWKKQPKNRNLLKRIRKIMRHKRLRQPTIELVPSGGHQVQFSGLNLYPVDFKMKHYIFLSMEHARRKYVEIDYPEGKKFDWRAGARGEMFHAPMQSELRRFRGDDKLDPSAPRKEHIFIS